MITVSPKIDRKYLQSRKVKVGSVLKLEADVKGEPEPTITWTFKDQTLKSHERLKIENVDYHTSFVLQKCTRDDGGKYVVTAKNDSGTDTVEIDITVVSKPAKPKGPLKVSFDLRYFFNKFIRIIKHSKPFNDVYNYLGIRRQS